jgi:hypothetical protein
MASRIALLNFRGVCEVDFVFVRSEEVLFVEGFLRPLILLKCANEWQSLYQNIFSERSHCRSAWKNLRLNLGTAEV